MYTNIISISSPAPAQASPSPLPLSRSFAWLVAVCAAALVSAPLIIGWTAGILLK